MLDLTNKKFGKLTVLKLQEKRPLTYKGGKRGFAYYWLCQCECGNKKIIRQDHIIKNGTLSCGCLQKQIAREKCLQNNKTHELSHHKLYKIYYNIKSRCYNPKTQNYYLYGGRGIKMCKDWYKDFFSFYTWAINNDYKEDLTIDRIDVNKDYEPNNCRWIDIKTQANNRRNNHYITCNNETHTIAEWAEKLKLKRGTLSARINNYNWSIEKALFTKV